MTIDRAAIYTPSPREVLIINGATGGRTTNWLMRVNVAAWMPGEGYGLTISGQLTAAKLNPTSDLLRDNQKASIDRLLAHLKHHCPQLLGEGTCNHIGGTDA